MTSRDPLIAPLAELARRWREDADLLASYGDERGATVCRRHADALDAALASQGGELLDLATAARVSGYSPDRLRHLVASGQVPNAGRKGSPRVRRADLPVKPRPAGDGFDAAGKAAAILRRPI
jgi:hypothetical protein